MLAGLLFRVLREPFRHAFVHLPPLPATTTLPDEITGLRFSLMRAMQGMRSATLHQFGGNGLSSTTRSVIPYCSRRSPSP